MYEEAKSKGSYEIENIINKLKSNFDIELNIIKNLSNHQVKQKIKESDLVIDQIYSDVPLAGLASEAVSLNKPVIVCGYYSDFLKKDLKTDIIEKELYINPMKLQEKLIDFIINRKNFYDHYKKIYKKIRKKNNSLTVSRKYIDLINSSLEKQYFFDPNRISYYYGYGLSEHEIKSTFKNLSKNNLEKIFNKKVAQKIIKEFY